MSERSDIEKSFTCWSGAIIGVGLALIVVQLGAQLYFEHEYKCALVTSQCTTNKAAMTAWSYTWSYIGLVVLLAGAALMAWVSLISRWRADRASALEARVKVSETGASALDTRASALETRVKELETRASALDKRASAFESGVTALQSEVKTVSAEVKALKPA